MEMFQNFNHEIDLLLLCLRECQAQPSSVIEFVGGAIMKATKGDSGKLKGKMVNFLLNKETISVEKILGKTKTSLNAVLLFFLHCI